MQFRAAVESSMLSFASSTQLTDSTPTERRTSWPTSVGTTILRDGKRIVGPGKVVAQVSVELDHAERSTQQRKLDGNGAVVISSRTREASSDGGTTTGVPGTTANIPEIGGVATGGTLKSTTEADEVANVDVPETRTQTSSLPGQVLGVSASVVVDGSWAKGEDDEDPLQYTERSAEELKQFTVVNRPFARWS